MESDWLIAGPYNNIIIIYKCLDRVTTMPQEDFLMGPVVKKLLVKIP